MDLRRLERVPAADYRAEADEAQADEVAADEAEANEADEAVDELGNESVDERDPDQQSESGEAVCQAEGLAVQKDGDGFTLVATTLRVREAFVCGR